MPIFSQASIFSSTSSTKTASSACTWACSSAMEDTPRFRLFGHLNFCRDDNGFKNVYDLFPGYKIAHSIPGIGNKAGWSAR